MHNPTGWNRPIALFGLRQTLAAVSMLIGFYKIFVTGLENEYQWFLELERWFPSWFLMSVNYYAAFVELIAGFLLCIGLFRDYALYFILSVLVIVTYGHSIEHEVWDMHQLVFRMLMLLPLLLLPAHWDVLRLDICFGPTRRLTGLSLPPQSAA